MPPGPISRYLFCAGLEVAGNMELSLPAPYRFTAHADTIQHTVTDGDTLHALADRYYAPAPRAASLWWVLADFQPDPILDPTLPLAAGRVLYIPSPRVAFTVILGEARRKDYA